MFGGNKPSDLDMQIAKAVQSLNNWDIQSEEYEKALSQISKLQEVKGKENPSRIDPNSAMVVAANLVGIVLIIKHEQVNVISSKAMSLVMKPKS